MQTRKVSGAVIIHSTKVLLVRSSSNTKWVFPKGGVEINLSKKQNALKEVYEEAGIIGSLGKRICTYKKLKQGIPQHVTMFLMKSIFQIKKHYPESKLRKRNWFTFNEARLLLDKQNKFVLERAIKILG